MKLDPIGSNMTEVEISNSITVLFSYRTPVAALVNGKYIRTSTKWSQTTSRHINKWLDGAHAEIVPQETIDDLCEEK